MNTLTFLLSTVIELYTMVLLLRIWMQWAHCAHLDAVRYYASGCSGLIVILPSGCSGLIVIFTTPSHSL